MKNASLINLLNRQFNREVSALLRFLIEAASLSGESHATTRTLYLNEVSEKVECAQYLADQIVALGGEPTLSPDIVRPQATLRQMLRRDAVEEQTDEQNYLELATEAEKAGLSPLKQKMQEQAVLLFYFPAQFVHQPEIAEAFDSANDLAAPAIPALWNHFGNCCIQAGVGSRHVFPG